MQAFPFILLLMLLAAMISYWAGRKPGDKKELATDLAIAFAGGLLVGVLAYLFVFFARLTFSS